MKKKNYYHWGGFENPSVNTSKHTFFDFGNDSRIIVPLSLLCLSFSLQFEKESKQFSHMQLTDNFRFCIPKIGKGEKERKMEAS